MAIDPGLISQGADDVLSAAADISASFQEAARNAVLYQRVDGWQGFENAGPGCCPGGGSAGER